MKVGWYKQLFLVSGDLFSMTKFAAKSGESGIKRIKWEWNKRMFYYDYS